VAVRLLPLARLVGRPGRADRQASGVWSPWLPDSVSPLVTVCWTTVVAGTASWDLDKQPFVFVDAFVSQCGDLPTAASTWTHNTADRRYFLLIYSRCQPAGQPPTHTTFMRFLFYPV